MTSAGTSVSPLTPADDLTCPDIDSGEAAIDGQVRFTAYCRLRHYGMSPSLAFLLSQAGFGSPSVASFFGGV